MHRISARSERSSRATTVRRITGFLAVHDVRSDSQNRLGRHGVAIGWQSFNFLHKAFNQVTGNAVYALVVVAILRIFAVNFEIHRQAIFVTNWFHAGIFDGRQGIRRHRQARDAARHGAINITIVQRHQRGFVAVFVMHVVDDVQCADVLHRQPVHEVVEAVHHFVVVQHVVHQRCRFRADLNLQLFIHPAVDCIQQRFGKVGACAEELHLLTNHHWANAAGNRVIVAVEVSTHQIVVFILQGRGDDGDLCRIFFEGNRQCFRPQNGQVRFRCWPHGVQGMQITERVFGYQRTTVQPHPADHFRGPNGVAGEQRIKFRCTQEAHHTDLHDEVVDQFLRLLLVEHTSFEVTFNIDIEERCGTAQRHRPAILRFHRRQVSEVEPLYRFLRILRRARDVEAVFRRHFLNLQQRMTMLCQLLAQTDGGFQILAFFQPRLKIGKLQFAFTHQITNAIQRYAAIVTDNTSTAITIG